MSQILPGPAGAPPPAPSPCPRVAIRFEPAGGGQAGEATTDGRGRFRAALPPGRYRLVAARPDYLVADAAEVAEEVLVEPGRVRAVRLMFVRALP